MSSHWIYLICRSHPSRDWVRDGHVACFGPMRREGVLAGGFWEELPGDAWFPPPCWKEGPGNPCQPFYLHGRLQPWLGGQPPLKAGRAGGPCRVTLLSSWASHLSSSSPAGPRLSPEPVKSCWGFSALLELGFLLPAGEWMVPRWYLGSSFILFPVSALWYEPYTLNSAGVSVLKL